MTKRIILFLITVFIFTAVTNFSAYAEDKEPVWDANIVVLESHKLADNVYAFYQKDAANLVKQGVPLATSGGFVVGDEGVLIIDTMMTKRLTDQVLAMIKDVTDKPVRYAINTSYHGDHSYGNYLLPADALIIQHVNTKAYVDANFAKDIAFMIDTFATGRGIEDAIARTGDILVPEGGEITLDLGNIEVQVKDFGFAQTGGDLFVWLPEQKVMWTGNPIISEAPSLPWLLDGHLEATLTTMKAVHDFLPEDAKVVPGHGATTSPAAVKWNVDYLQDVRNAVQKAIVEGKTLEETVQALPMDKYKGYGLFGWVHSALNVPAAYKGLSKQ